MLQEKKKIRKIAANYIYWPGSTLVKNGYVEISASQEVKVVDTGGQMKEIAGLEFYGGLIVPDYIYGFEDLFLPEAKMLPFLEQLFALKGSICQEAAIIEGADLLQLVWKKEARIRLL